MKRYIRDNSAGGQAVEVSCYACGKRSRLSSMLVDPEGPAFLAYYHGKCRPVGDCLVEVIGFDGRDRYLETWGTGRTKV